jgi:hypothetical protein
MLGTSQRANRPNHLEEMKIIVVVVICARNSRGKSMQVRAYEKSSRLGYVCNVSHDHFKMWYCFSRVHLWGSN